MFTAGRVGWYYWHYRLVDTFFITTTTAAPTLKWCTQKLFTEPMSEQYLISKRIN